MGANPKRSWLERLGLQRAGPGPDDWIVITHGKLDSESRSTYAEEIIELLKDAGLDARTEPYVLPDDSALHGVTGDDGLSARDRVRIAVLVHSRDQARAEDIVRRRPRAEPISDEELARLAKEAGPRSDR